MASQYPFDPHGNNPANLIQNEQIPLTKVNDPPVNMVVPAAAPFFRRDLEVRYRPPGVIGDGTLMIEGVDYFLGWKFIAASRTIGEPVYGSIIFTDPNKQGSALIKKYRTLGGDWVQTPQDILDMLNNVLFHPRVTSWDEVTPQLVAFPVVNHPHNISDLRGMEDVIAAIAEIPPAIMTAAATGLSNHLAQVNPHNITKFIINLGNVENYPVASASEANAALSDQHYMTPLKTRQLLEAALGSAGLGGLIFGDGGSGPVDGADVTGPAGGVANGEVALYDGTTGKFIKGTAGALHSYAAADRRGLEIRYAAGLRPGVRFTVAGGRVDVMANAALTGNIDITLPSSNGTLVTVEQITISQGRVPFRNAAGNGAPDASLIATQNITADAVVIRKTNTQISVPDVPLIDSDATSKKYVDTTFVPLNADLFLRVDGLQNAAATPSTQRAYSSSAVNSILQGYTTVDAVNQMFDDLELGTILRPDTDLFVRIADLLGANDTVAAGKVFSAQAVVSMLELLATDDALSQGLTSLRNEIDPTTILRTNTTAFVRLNALQAATDVPAADKVFSSAAVATLLQNVATIDSVNTAIDELENTIDPSTILRTTDTDLLRKSELVPATATPNNTTAYHTAAVDTLLEDYATREWVEQIVEDLTPGEGPVLPTVLEIVRIQNLVGVEDIALDTFVIVDNADENAVLNVPTEDLEQGSRFSVAVLNNADRKIVLFGDMIDLYGTDTGNHTIRDSNVLLTYQYDTTLGWVRTNVSNFYYDNKTSSGADFRLVGVVTLDTTLPELTDYDFGNGLEIATTVVIGGHTYNANSILIRGTNGWVHIGGEADTADLEATIDVLITGFDQLSAALQL